MPVIVESPSSPRLWLAACKGDQAGGFSGPTRGPYPSAVQAEQQFQLSGADVKVRRRGMIIAVLVITGVAVGWLTLNLGLDFLLGGRTFR